MEKSSRTRRSSEPRRPCTACRHSVRLSALNAEGVCDSCANQGALFAIKPDARPRRHDGRWL